MKNTIADRVFDFIKDFPPFNFLDKEYLSSISANVQVSYLENDSYIFKQNNIIHKSLDTGILFKKTTLHKTDSKHYGLDELSEIFNIKKHDRHAASGNAHITGLIFLKTLSKLKQTNKKITLKDLFFNRNTRGFI